MAAFGRAAHKQTYWLCRTDSTRDPDASGYVLGRFGDVTERRRWPSAATVGLTLMLLVSGCSLSLETMPEGPPGVPQPCVGIFLGEWRLVRVAGSLGLESDEGQFQVTWPPRFTAQQGEATVLLDRNRRIVGTEGDVLRIGGTRGQGRLNVCEIDGVVYT